jgi:tRNA (cytidine/uridine-2'-O-)-methyltransferase
VFNIVLYQPEIPPNTGNIIRLCANTGARLHLVEPLGFNMSDRELKRAGLDYHEYAEVAVHADLDACRAVLGNTRLHACSVRGRLGPAEVHFAPGDTLLFGCETRGLPEEILDAPWLTTTLRIPMRPGVRSLNLSNAVAIVTYEAWRQQGYSGAG